MWKIILGLLIIIFAFIGFIESVRAIIFRLYKPKKEHTALIITTAKHNSEDIEYTLRSWVARAKWMGKARPDSIICLDNGLNSDSRKICKNVCKDYDFMYIMSVDELCSKLSKKEYIKD